MAKFDFGYIIEGVKELLRTALLAVVPLVIVGLQSGNVDYKAVGVAGVIALLSGIDKWLHIRADDTGILKSGGLTGF